MSSGPQHQIALLDVNVLIALIDPRHIHHDAAHRGPSPLSQFPRRTRQGESRLAPADRPRSAPRARLASLDQRLSTRAVRGADACLLRITV